MFDEIPLPLPPEADQRGKYKEISPFVKGGARGIFE